MKRLAFLLFTIAVINTMMVAQNSKYIAEVSSFGDYPMCGKTFYIISGDSRISNNDLEFQYYRDIITQCLLRFKAIPTNNYDSADVCILLDYGITDESYVATRSIPVFGRTGISSITTTSTTTGNVSGYGSAYSSASANSSGNSASGYGNSSSSGHVNGSSTTCTTQNYNYDYGVTGYREQSYQVNKYRRVLNLYAYDNKNRDNEPIMLWRTNVTSDGRSNDLQDVFPYMAQISLNYMGANSKGKKRYHIFDNSPDALAMKEMYYLKENVIVNPTNFDTNVEKYIWMRSVQLEDTHTVVALLANKPKNRSIIKFRKNTYIIYKGQKYPLEVVKLPFQASSLNLNYINTPIALQENTPLMIMLVFPVQMQKGDSFDLVSYYNKKETRELVSLKNIIIE
ncbi:MAG: hypothetical protein ACI3Z5_07295 [Paludibacteraceae bacterium]